MKTLYEILFLFMIGSSLGWCLELCYRSIKNKKLVNPGFCSGPCLPIYGLGTVILYFLELLTKQHIENVFLCLIVYTILVIIIMTILELIGGLIFIKGMNIKLWDYSRQWGNFKGIICPLFSAIWGVCGIAYYYLINPWLSVASENAINNTFVILIIGIYYGIFIIDFSQSMNLGLKLRAIAIKLKTVIDYQELQRDWTERYKKLKKKSYFSLSSKLNSITSITQETIKEGKLYKYFEEKIDSLQEKFEKIKNEIEDKKDNK